MPYQEELNNIENLLQTLKKLIEKSRNTFSTNLNDIQKLINSIQEQQDDVENLLIASIDKISKLKTKDQEKKPILLKFIDDITPNDNRYLKLLSMLKKLQISAGTNSFLNTQSSYRDSETQKYLTNEELIKKTIQYLDDNKINIDKILPQAYLCSLIQKLNPKSKKKIDAINELLLEAQKNIVCQIVFNNMKDAYKNANHTEIFSDLFRLFDTANMDIPGLLEDLKQNEYNIYNILDQTRYSILFNANITKDVTIRIDEENINTMRGLLKTFQKKNIPIEQFYFIFDKIKPTTLSQNFEGVLITHGNPKKTDYGFIINQSGEINISVDLGELNLCRPGDDPSIKAKKYYFTSNITFDPQRNTLSIEISAKNNIKNTNIIFDYSKIQTPKNVVNHM